MSVVVPDPAVTDWIPLGGVGGGALVPIQEITLGAAAASIDFTNIPQGYTSLVLQGAVRGTDAALQTVYARFNGDAGANYDTQNMLGAGTAATAQIGTNSPGCYMAVVTGTGAPAGVAVYFDATIPGYRDTSFFKGLVSSLGYVQAGGSIAMLAASTWRSTAAINRITIVPSAGNFVAGSKATLYGIAPPGLTTPLGGAYYGASPPASPYDGQEWILPADAAGTLWRFRYNAASASAYKWEFVGGASLSHEIAGANTSTSTVMADLSAPVGPQVTVPRAGDYEITASCAIYNASGAPAMTYMYAGIKLGAAAVGIDEQITFPRENGYQMSGAMTFRRTLAASDVVKMQYATASAANPVGFVRRSLFVRPVRVS